MSHATDILVDLIRRDGAFDVAANQLKVVTLQETLAAFGVEICTAVCGKLVKVPGIVELERLLKAEQSRLAYLAKQSERKASREQAFVTDDDPEVRARVVAGFKTCIQRLRVAPDPVPMAANSGKPVRLLGAVDYPSQKDNPAYLASLLASHDAGLAEQAQRRAGKGR